MSVTLRLDDDIDISRGDMICRPHNQPTVGTRLRGDGLLDDRAARCARARATRSSTPPARVRAVVDDLRYRIDVNTLHRDESADDARRSTTSAACSLRTERAAVLRRLPAQPHHRQLHPDRRGDQRHRRRGHDPRRRGRADRRRVATPSAAPTSRWQPARASTRERALERARARAAPRVWFTGPAGLGQVDDRRGGRGAPARRRARRPTCSTATTCATASTATSASTADAAPRTCAAPREVARLFADAGHGRARPARQPVPRGPRARAARCTTPRACRSSRSSSTRRSRSASSATRRASTRRRAPASCTGFTGIDDPYEPPGEPGARGRAEAERQSGGAGVAGPARGGRVPPLARGHDASRRVDE